MNSITSSVTVNISSFSGMTGSVSSGNTYPPSNGVNSSGNTSSYAIFSGTSNSSSGYVYYNFDILDIPSDAVINSVSCVARGRVSNASRCYAAFQLMAGSTAKGSAAGFNTTTVSACTLTTGSWTASELENVRLRITVRRAANQAGSAYFYGSTLTVNFSTTAYDIISTSNTDKATIEPNDHTIAYEGDEMEFIVRSDDIDNIVVTDNDADVTDLLVERQVSPNHTFSGVPIDYVASGLVYNSSSVGQASTAHTLCIGEPSSTSNNSTASVYRPSSQSTNTTIDYTFDFSDIPSYATIDSVSVTVKGHIESTSQSNRKAGLRLYAGNTAKGSESNFTTTANTVVTMTAGTWTRAELDTAKLRFEIGVYGGLIVGATFAVAYSVPPETQYVYTLSNINADHTIIVKESEVIIPEEEDTGKTYHSVTVSSINASTNPGRGTIRVEDGGSLTVTINPTETLVTLMTDNGVDITGSVSGSTGEPSYTVSNITTQYGFTLSASTGYYTSTNKGVASSAAVSRVNFNLPVRCLITIEYINYAEATYDFGVFSKVDTALSTDAWVASSNAGDTTTDAGLEQIRLNTSAYNSAAARTLTYEIASGQHFIDVKYGKDQGTNSNNDTLQWKIVSIEPLETYGGYTYTISSVTEDHSLIFIFGDVQYYFLESEGNGCKLYPNGTSVVLAGGSYKLSIVPNGIDDTVIVRDNNVDVTQYVTKVEAEIEKDGETVVIVNYVYNLSNISAAHNIEVACDGSKVLIKISGNWVTVKKCYKKGVRGWEEVTDIETLFEAGKMYWNTNP